MSPAIAIEVSPARVPACRGDGAASISRPSWRLDGLGSITRSRDAGAGRTRPVGPLLDQTSAQRLGYGRGAVRRAELLEDVLEVGLYGVGRDVEALGDVAVRVAERKERDRKAETLTAR